MKFKDLIWGFYDVYEERDKKNCYYKCKDCGEKVSGKIDRIKNYRERCVKLIFMIECNNELIFEGILFCIFGFNILKKRLFSLI